MVLMVFSIVGGTVEQRRGIEKPTWRQDLVRERRGKAEPAVRPAGFYSATGSKFLSFSRTGLD
jgi:hypothetical protein